MLQKIGCLCSCCGFARGGCIALHCKLLPHAVLCLTSQVAVILLMIKGIIALFALPALSDVLTQGTHEPQFNKQPSEH